MTHFFPVPVDPLPRLVLAARSIHGDLPSQGWIIDGLWGMHLYRYHAGLSIGGHHSAIEPGYASFTPPGERAEYSFRERSVHVFTHFAFDIDAEVRPLPLVFPVGARFPHLWCQMEEVIGFFPTDRRRAEVRAWDVFLTLLDIAAQPHTDLPSPVWRTIERIEQRLHEPLSVVELAEEAGLSPNHLTRLFRAATGQTVVGTIQIRRMERARHLLQYSNMPIKQIANQVGIPDLHHFNKSVRHHLGSAPSMLRENRSGSANTSE